MFSGLELTQKFTAQKILLVNVHKCQNLKVSKKLILLLAILDVCSTQNHAQTATITTAQAKEYIGKEVVLKGKLLGIKP